MQPDRELPPKRHIDAHWRKFILHLLVLGVSVVVLSAVHSFESCRTPSWQSELERYLRLSESSPGEVRVIAAVKATSPQNFAPDRVTAVQTDWSWEGISEIPPPTSVQCVRLESRSSHHEIFGSIRKWHVILIGYHDDGLWHAGWLVHEINYDVGEQELEELLAKLGCNLGLDNLQALSGVIEQVLRFAW